MKFYTTYKISENIRETPEGFLVCTGVSIARTGEMVYAKGEVPLEADTDGRVIIARAAEEVFRAETIASFEGKAITIGHPTDFVSPSNWVELAKGVIQNVRRGTASQEGDLVSDLLITDAQAIGLVKGGLREVSCGYEAEYIQTGIGRGIQKNILGNHLALVDEGRAGSSYAIVDHKGKESRMKVGDKIRAIFGKAMDEAVVLAETKDVGAPPTPEVEKGAVSYDDLMRAVKDLGEKVCAMGKPKDASTAPTENEPAKVVAKDDEVATGLEARLAKLEGLVSKLLEAKAESAASDEVDPDEGEGEAEDEGPEEAMVGDSASRVEILAPGMNPRSKGVKAKALLAAYGTKDGKAVLDQLTGSDKTPELKDEKRVDMLFVAASELLKVSRSSELTKTKTHDFKSNLGIPEGVMTPEKMNEMNKKHYGAK